MRQWRQECARGGAVAVRAGVGKRERSQQPAPHGALVIGAVPPALARLWRRADGARQDRRALDPQRIVASAIQIADREGLPALSMARLAERLGCAPMSLYRHVASKDELLTLMRDLAPGAQVGTKRDHEYVMNILLTTCRAYATKPKSCS